MRSLIIPLIVVAGVFAHGFATAKNHPRGKYDPETTVTDSIVMGLIIAFVVGGLVWILVKVVEYNL
jgi:hypothetical protein